MTAASDNEAAAPRLWTRGGFIADEWRHLTPQDGAPAPAGGRVILPLEDWLEAAAGWNDAEASRPGVLLRPGDALDAILSHLPRIPLVALAFPAFSDGRSHSKAALLRSRHGYEGIVRAVGDVLIDQIPLMLRNGFDEFEVTNETALRRLSEGRVGGIPFHYQPAPAGDGKGERYSWRRLAG